MFLLFFITPLNSYLPNLKCEGQLNLFYNVNDFVYKNTGMGTEELAQWLRGLDSLEEVLGSVPNTHKVSHKQLSLQYQGFQCPLLASARRHMIHIHTEGKTLMRINTNKIAN